MIKLNKLFLLLMMIIVGNSSAWGDTHTLTFVPTSKNDGTFTQTGSGISYSFANTANSNNDQVTKDKTMTLTLSGFQSGDRITGIKLNLHNNKSSGKGTISAVFGGSSIGEMTVTGLGNTYKEKELDVSNTALSESGNLVITISCSENSVYCNQFTITYETNNVPAVSNPTFNPIQGIYNSAQSVEISTSTSGATIYYTTDNSDPASSSTRQAYSSAISINKTTTIRAIAEKSGLESSAEASATYTLKVGTPYISVQTGTYSSPQSVSIYCSKTPYATIYYTIDGSDPATSASRIQYSGDFEVNTNSTVRAIATYGEMDMSDEASSEISFQTAKPTFSPAAGVYSSAQTITLACATDEAVIYYTLDGSTPTSNSTQYSSPITVSETTTIKAMAVRNGWSESEVASATYTIREISDDAFIKATSVSDLADGMEVIIVNENAKKTLGAQQENNFYTVDVTFDKSMEPYTASPAEGATIMTLEGSERAWYFKTANGYLYAASSSSNQLKTEQNKDDNAKATISFSNDNNATIKFQGSNTRNIIRYNSSYTLFSCYSSGLQDVQIYYRNGHTVGVPVFSPAGGEITETTEITITATEGNTIYYTTDGSDPVSGGKITGSAKLYSGALTFNKAVTVKAVAMDGEGNLSRIATASYSYAGSVSVPYYENFDEGLGNFTTESTGTNPPEWIFRTNSSEADIEKYGEVRKYAFVTGNNSKQGTARLISPIIDLTDKTITTASLNFIHAGRYFDGYNKDNQTEAQTATGEAPSHAQLFIREDGGTWGQVTIPNWFTQNSNYTRRNSGEISLKDYVGKKIQVSFLYTADNESTGTWNVLKFAVTTTNAEAEDSYETVSMKTDGYVTYVVQNDIDWVKTLAKNTTEEGNKINIHGYKVVEFTDKTAVFVEFGVENPSSTKDKWYSEPMIPAETPIILKGTAGDNLLTIAKSNDVIAKPIGNLLKPSYGDVIAAAGQKLLVFQKEPDWTASDPYKNYAFYLLTTGRQIPNRKAYLNVNDISEELSINVSNPANGIYLLQDLGNEETLGQTEIGELRHTFDLNAPVYDLSGRRVGNGIGGLKAGLYIMNGRKIIIK